MLTGLRCWSILCRIFWANLVLATPCRCDPMFLHNWEPIGGTPSCHTQTQACLFMSICFNTTLKWMLKALPSITLLQPPCRSLLKKRKHPPHLLLNYLEFLLPLTHTCTRLSPFCSHTVIKFILRLIITHLLTGTWHQPDPLHLEAALWRLSVVYVVHISTWTPHVTILQLLEPLSPRPIWIKCH